MYRAITLLALESLPSNDAPHDAESLVTAAREVVASVKLEFRPAPVIGDGAIDSQLRLMADDSDITERIRSAKVSSSVSIVAADISVREALVALQRRFGERFKDIVAEGRDIGTVVFPDAELKVYLDADLKERAIRRAKEMNASGMSTTLEEQMEEIAYRDEFDSAREASPLRQADDAIRIDTSGMTIDGQVDAVLALVRERRLTEGGQ